MTKVILRMNLVVKDTEEDPDSPDSEVFVTYVVGDDIDEDFRKSKACNKSITLSSSVADVWEEVKSAVESDEGLTAEE